MITDTILMTTAFTGGNRSEVSQREGNKPFGPVFLLLLYVALAASCLLMAGCGQDEAPGGEASGTGVALQLGSVEVLTPKTGTATRATVGYTDITTENDRIGVFRKANATYTVLQNVPYEYMKLPGQTVLEWLPAGGDEQTVWLYPAAQADIAVYYPYNENLSLAAGTGVVNLASAIRNASTPQDLWYGHCQASGKNYKVASLSLNQAYARMKIIFVTDESVSYVEKPYLYKLVLSGGRADASSTTDGIFSAATLDMYTGIYTRGTKDYTPVDITTNTYQAAGTAETTQAVFDLMAIPAALTDAINLTVNVGGTASTAKTMNLSIPAADFGGKLEAGKIYKVSVKIKGTDIGEFSTVVTTSWDTSLLSGNGTTVDGQRYYDFNNPSF